MACAQGGERSKVEEVKEDQYPSVVPFLPPLTDDTIRQYWTFYLSAVAVIITFGAILAPALELHLGMGGAQSHGLFRARVKSSICRRLIVCMPVPHPCTSVPAACRLGPAAAQLSSTWAGTVA